MPRATFNLESISRRLDAEGMVAAGCFLVIALGILARLSAYLYNRSLFLDEAMLASSIVQRDFAGLWGALDFSQGAPPGFLMLAKAVVCLLGHSEFALRLPSLLAGLGSIALFYAVLKHVFCDPRPYLGTALFAAIPFEVYYSIEVKPYMLDVFIALLTVLVFGLVHHRRAPHWLLVVYCGFAVWMSYPVIFPLAAFCGVWVLCALARKEKQEEVWWGILAGAAAAASFLVLLLTVYTHQNVSFTTGSRNYGYGPLSFPLIPRGESDIRILRLMASHYLAAIDLGNQPLVIALSAGGLFHAVCAKKHRAVAAAFVLVTGLVLFASWLGRYPMQNRLLLFLAALHVLVLAAFVSVLWGQSRIASLVIALSLMCPGARVLRYFQPEGVYRPRQEVNPAIRYWQERHDGRPLYLYPFATPQYEYKTGYQCGLKHQPPEPVERGGVIYGSLFFEYPFAKPYSWASTIVPEKLERQVEAIAKHASAYLLFANHDEAHLTALVEGLKQRGTVRQVLSSYQTPLYLFEREPRTQEMGK